MLPLLGVSAGDQRLACGTKRVLQRLVAIEPLYGVAIEKLTSGEKFAVDRGQFGFLADGLPLFGDGRDLLFDQRGSFRLLQVVIRRSRKAGRQRARASLALDQHRLSGFGARAVLRADVIGGRECHHRTVPERRMVAGMVVGVAAKHVKANPSVELLECIFGGIEAMADQFCLILIRSIAGHHLIKAKYRQRRDHRLPRARHS